MTFAIIIGLDVGTTAVKAVGFRLDSPDRVVASREHPLREPVPGHLVQEPGAILAAVDAALGEVAARIEGEPRALVISAALHGLVGTDAAGIPVTPLMTWADARATAVLADVTTEAAGLHQLTGTPVHPMSPLLKLRWYAEHEPATTGRVRWWLGLKELVVGHLTGEQVTEVSSASGTGLFDRWRQEWSPEAAQVARVDVARLPAVLPTAASLPLTAAAAERTGLPRGLPVVLGAGDGPLGNVGTGALGDGVAGLSLGTSGAIRVLVTEQPERLEPAQFCYALDDRTWAVGGAISNGASVMRWLAGAVGGDGPPGPATDAALLDLAAQVPAGSEGLLMLPYLMAERAPLWDPTVPGAYLGLRRHHGRGHLARAAVEGVALQLALVAAGLEQVAPVRRVHATGGAFRSPLWGEVLAGTLNRDVVVTGGPEGTARGAAALGVRALGLADDLAGALARLPEPAATVTHRPRPADVAAYARVASVLPTVLPSLEAVARLLADR